MNARPLPALALVCACLIATACGSSSGSSSSSTTSAAQTSAASQQQAQVGFEGVPIEQGAPLAPASTTQTGVVDGINCGPTEQLNYHIHAHLAVYVDGNARQLPGGIGIPGSQTVQSQAGPVATGGQCIYWLHTHAPDGVIHVESPTSRIYTLRDFFNVWHQPLSASRVASASGKVTAYVDGRLWTKDPTTIPLVPHAVIQLDVGSPPAPFQAMSWAGLQL